MTSFSLPGWTGELAADLRPLDLNEAVRRLTDPAAALKTLHWGRNYLYVSRLETAGGPVEVVVKQFRHRGRRGPAGAPAAGSAARPRRPGAWPGRSAKRASSRPSR